MNRLLATIAIFSCCFCGRGLLADFTGKVVSVTDGDTVTVLRGEEQVKVRFDGVDAPERKQPFGTRGRQPGPADGYSLGKIYPCWYVKDVLQWQDASLAE